MTDKKLVDIEVYGDNSSLSYTGRCLGLLTMEEYAGIISRPKLRSKMLNVATKPLKDICNKEDIKNCRLVIDAKKRNNVAINKKILFISAEIDHVSHILADNDVSFITVDGAYMTIMEVST